MSSNFTVSLKGFTAPDGDAFSIRGLNADVQDALTGYPNVFTDFPGLTAIRLNCFPSTDSLASIQQVVQEYTSHGVVVEVEDHADSDNGDNTAWYAQMADAFKSNPYVFLETPNEPSGTGQQVADNQISIINAIRATGYTNPIGLQAGGGWDESCFQLVVNAVGSSQLYAAPHEYYYGTDPNGAESYLNSLVSGATSAGLYTWIDEFGNDDGDGVSPAPYGNSVITDVISANEAGTIGATFWAMDNYNHSNGVDSAFLTPNGSQLTSTGTQYIAPWLSQPQTGGGGGNPPPPPTTAYITPGSGSFTDASGNVYTIDASDNADENGSPIPGGSGTGAMELYNGAVYGEDAASGQWYTWNQSTWAAAAAPPMPSSNPTISVSSGSHPKVNINAGTAQTTTVYGATIALTASGVANVTLGSSSDTMKFLNMTAVNVTAGSVKSCVTANQGNNTFTGGAGALTVTGGSGADSYIFHAGDATMSVNDFSAAKGDTLTIDKSLQAYMVEKVDTSGSLNILFHDQSGYIHLTGLTTLSNSAMHFA